MKGTKSSMASTCCMGMCSRCHNMKWLIVGLIFLANHYWPFADWWTLIGWLLVIGGIIKLFKPTCGHC